MAKPWRWLLLLLLLATPVIAVGWALKTNNAPHAKSVQPEKNMSQYDWMARNSAPKGCPMEIVEGGFQFVGGGSVYIPPASLHSGWGQPVSAHVVGEDTKPLPDRMHIRFYSFLEDKIYEGEFTLPYARIAKLFAEGYRSDAPGHQPRAHYDEITAGVAPGGAVALWLGGIGRRTEVFFGRADVIDGDFHDLMGLPAHVDRNTHREEQLTQASERDPLVARSQEKIPLGIWETYRTRYHWQPVFEGMGTPTALRWIFYVNGEQEDLFLPLSETDQHALRPVPINLYFLIPQPEKYERKYDITFDEAEMLATFQRLGRNEAPLELVFRTEAVEGGKRFNVLVRNRDETVVLTELASKFFRINP
jgi:hypothetical protein